MASLDELRERLAEAGIDERGIDELIDALESAPVGDELVERIGELIGRLARGAATGATGIDPELLRLLLELFGPSLRDVFGRLFDRFLHEGGYDVSQPELTKWRRINRDPHGVFDLEDELPPDLRMLGTPRVRCEEPDGLAVTFRIEIERREEEIRSVCAQAFGSEGDLFAAWPREPGRPELPRDLEVGARHVLEVELSIPCHQAVLTGGTVPVLLGVEDVDGNQTWVAVAVSVADALLRPDACCRHMSEGELRKILLRLFEHGNPNRRRFDELLRRFLESGGRDVRRERPPARPVPAEDAAPRDLVPALVDLVRTAEKIPLQRAVVHLAGAKGTPIEVLERPTKDGGSPARSPARGEHACGWVGRFERRAIGYGAARDLPAGELPREVLLDAVREAFEDAVSRLAVGFVEDYERVECASGCRKVWGTLLRLGSGAEVSIEGLWLGPDLLEPTIRPRRPRPYTTRYEVSLTAIANLYVACVEADGGEVPPPDADALTAGVMALFDRAFGR